MVSHDPVLRVLNVSKSFRELVALNSVTFEVSRGEILCIIGDNAAGKSTLLKTIVGFHRQDHGDIYLGDVKLNALGPKDRRSLGVEMVYQDLALAEHLNVLDNLFLGREFVRRYGPIRILDASRMVHLARQALTDLDLPISLAARVRSLSGGQRQGVAIARASIFETKVVLMDEPTASLSTKKVEEVLHLIIKLKQRGVAVILITHRLPDIFKIGDRILIMREGAVLTTRRPVETSTTELEQLISYGEVME